MQPAPILPRANNRVCLRFAEVAACRIFWGAAWGSLGVLQCILTLTLFLCRQAGEPDRLPRAFGDSQTSLPAQSPTGPES